MPATSHCVRIDLAGMAMSLDCCSWLKPGPNNPQTLADLCCQQLDLVSASTVDPRQVTLASVYCAWFKFNHRHRASLSLERW